MIRRAAALSDGEVSSVILVEVDDNGQTDFNPPNHDIVVLKDDEFVEVGWVYSDGGFLEPKPETEEAEEEPEDIEE